MHIKQFLKRLRFISFHSENFSRPYKYTSTCNYRLCSICKTQGNVDISFLIKTELRHTIIASDPDDHTPSLCCALRLSSLGARGPSTFLYKTQQNHFENEIMNQIVRFSKLTRSVTPELVELTIKHFCWQTHLSKDPHGFISLICGGGADTTEPQVLQRFVGSSHSIRMYNLLCDLFVLSGFSHKTLLA